jgi:dephospho-CoA kinase
MSVTFTPEQIAALKASTLVVIIGLPAAGKSTVADQVAEILPRHDLYRTDDYIDFGYEQSLYALIKDMAYNDNPRKIVEGVQGYRFLRKTLERDIVVDCIIEVQTDPQTRAERYLARGKKQLSSGFERNLATVLRDYTDGLAKMTKRPTIIQVFT